MTAADDALGAFLEALTTVDGTRLVRDKVRAGALDDWLEDRMQPRPVHVLAVGKAASSMAWGLREASVPFRGIGVVPQGTRVADVGALVWHKGEHPVPGPGSAAAADAVVAWVDGLPVGARVLVLLSGGASSIMERFQGDATSGQHAWQADLTAGLDIQQLNRRRARRSAIKGGRLGKRMRDRGIHVRVWLIADTPRALAAQTVGSSPFWSEDGSIPHDVLASNRDLCRATAQILGMLGRPARAMQQRLSGDTESAVAHFIRQARGQGESVIAGGETTVTLPEDGPPGGRCQHAALAAAQHLAEGEVFVALASDGVDGSTKEAGAWSDAATWSDGAAHALQRREAHAFLDAKDQTIRTGSLGTNVNDVWFLLRPPSA